MEVHSGRILKMKEDVETKSLLENASRESVGESEREEIGEIKKHVEKKSKGL